MKVGEIYKLKGNVDEGDRSINTVYRFKLVNYVGQDTWECKILKHDPEYAYYHELHTITGSNIMAYYELEA